MMSLSRFVWFLLDILMTYFRPINNLTNYDTNNSRVPNQQPMSLYLNHNRVNQCMDHVLDGQIRSLGARTRLLLIRLCWR